MTAPLIFTPEYYRRMRELESDGWWNAAMRDVAAMLLRDADLPETGTMLDVGCGSGQTMTWFSTLRPSWRTFGLDVAWDGLLAARQLGVEVFQGSALSIPHPNRSLDLVVTLDVMQHLPLGGGDVQALLEMRRVLRPGGYLLLRTNAQAFPRIPDDAKYNFHKYQTDELRQKMEEAGLEVVRLSKVNALLGLAEIPRELRAARDHGESNYRGILATAKPREHRVARALKRSWLRFEGRVMKAGLPLPLGRTIVALCRA